MDTLDAIIYWHRGNSKYLYYSIEQTKKYNKNLVLLGDKSNSNWPCTHYDMDLLPTDKLDEFKKSYVHLSLNNELFELRCFERYFYVLEYCKKYSIKRFVLCDSDILVYADLEKYFNNRVLAFSYFGSGGGMSPHCSLWSIEFLESFVYFLINYYSTNIEILEQMFEQYKITHRKGGICDMTLLSLWVKSNNYDFFNTAVRDIANNSIIDHAISNNDREYRFSKISGCKIIKYKRNTLYPIKFIAKNNTLVDVAVLHCSGGYKNYMKLIYKGRTNQIYLLIHRIFFKLSKKM